MIRLAFKASAALGALAAITLSSGVSQAARVSSMKPVLADVAMLEGIGVKPLSVEPITQVGFAEITSVQEQMLSELAHKNGKCGGFEALPFASGLSASSPLITHAFGQLADQEMKNRRFAPSTQLFSTMTVRPEIQAAILEVSEANMRETVRVMSAFSDRYYKGSNPNAAINAMKTRIEDTVKGSSLPVQVELIPHQGISQNSIRARIVGSTRPNEIVVLGGHVDSINQDWFGPKTAPGADDNASGSSNILEALRIISNQAQPERTIEFFWYAGEEGGLLGSAEIARTYKSQNKDVVAVLQLDMTLFPGSGQFVLGSMTDFTSAWLRNYLVNLNGLYINARIVDDKCGYGCSDHASWNKQGYPAIMPFEATFNGMNHNLHTVKDVVDSNSNFAHSAMFAKIAVAIGMDLGNSTLRETP